MHAIEKHLPSMIEEILDFYFENRISATQKDFVRKSELAEQLSHKLDAVVFKDYETRQINKDNRERF